MTDLCVPKVTLRYGTKVGYASVELPRARRAVPNWEASLPAVSVQNSHMPDDVEGLKFLGVA
jgi:hypothetical protein